MGSHMPSSAEAVKNEKRMMATARHLNRIANEFLVFYRIVILNRRSLKNRVEYWILSCGRENSLYLFSINIFNMKILFSLLTFFLIPVSLLFSQTSYNRMIDTGFYYRTMAVIKMQNTYLTASDYSDTTEWQLHHGHLQRFERISGC
jgi:hypothetical protein